MLLLPKQEQKSLGATVHFLYSDSHSVLYVYCCFERVYLHEKKNGDFDSIQYYVSFGGLMQFLNQINLTSVSMWYNIDGWMEC